MQFAAGGKKKFTEGAKSLTRQDVDVNNGGPLSKALVPRLDLRRVTEPDSRDLDVVKQESSACFHTEFMARVDEYSESWREAALKEQRTLLK